MSVFALEFPPLGHIVNWPGWFGTDGAWYEFNKVVLVYLIAMAMIFVILTLPIGVFSTSLSQRLAVRR